MDTTERIERCCDSHPDWATLARHLASDFSRLPERQVIRELVRARRAVLVASLDQPDDLFIAELIARSQLRALADGDLTDAARLNPQPHPRRRHPLAGARVDQLTG